jgi:hypothetical protein
LQDYQNAQVKGVCDEPQGWSRSLSAGERAVRR